MRGMAARAASTSPPHDYEAYARDRDLWHLPVPERFSKLPVLGIIRTGTHLGMTAARWRHIRQSP